MFKFEKEKAMRRILVRILLIVLHRLLAIKQGKYGSAHVVADTIALCSLIAEFKLVNSMITKQSVGTSNPEC